MPNLVLSVEDVSKLYRKGTIGSGSLRREIHELFAGQKESATDHEAFWALKEINFTVREGEVLGIIGSNGAGKSTLLKILSRIIKPTTGTIRGKGKVSSLLEIGTGFHHDLSGRENIFLSGYILGMKKAEIARRLDEIVAFSGVGEFLDTPIKRYSSGMYVRLAFAVAAHLEPDILIVDEVLAVGDIDFQKKCLGKMKEASHDRGRTILFVSHNMQAVNQLCTHGIWLEKGGMKFMGSAQAAVTAYMNQHEVNRWKREWPLDENAPGNEIVRLTSVELVPDFIEPGKLDIRTPLLVKFRLYNYRDNETLLAELVLFTASGECIFDVSHTPRSFSRGWIDAEVRIPGKFLNDGSYYFGIALFNDRKETLFYEEECVHFTVADYAENKDWYVKWWGYVRPDFPFSLSQPGDSV